MYHERISLAVCILSSDNRVEVIHGEVKYHHDMYRTVCVLLGSLYIVLISNGINRSDSLTEARVM